MSSCKVDCLSVEKGVLISRTGLFSRCLEMRLNLERGVARARGTQDLIGESSNLVSTAEMEER